MRLIDADTIVNYEITGNFECGDFKGLAQCVLLPVEHLRDIPTVYDSNSFEELKQIIRNETIDDFIKYIDECSGWTPNCIEHNIGLTVYTLHQIADELKSR